MRNDLAEYRDTIGHSRLRGRNYSYYGFDDDVLATATGYNTLDEFDAKAGVLDKWCRNYQVEHNKWPTVKVVFDAKLVGFKSKSEVNRIMKYLRDER